MEDIRAYLKNNVLVFDGAMGTLVSKYTRLETMCELANISNSELIYDIHAKYINVGSMALKTNTFGANRINYDSGTCVSIIKKGFEIASSFADRAYIFADIGPITVTDSDDIFKEYKFVTDTFLSLGAKHFLFETNSTLDGLFECADYIKSRCKDAYIIVSFAASPDGFTRSGQNVKKLLLSADATDNIDAIGLNCSSGARHMATVFEGLCEFTKPFSVMPNAGYPTVLNNRTYYEGDPYYFARQISGMVHGGAKIIGGCCGTTSEHIRLAIAEIAGPHRDVLITKSVCTKTKQEENKFWDELCNSSLKPFAVELDPPENSDVDKFMSGVKLLADNGVSVITIADCPIARARMDSSILACKLKRELGVGVLPHMTCRDRNLNAIKALLLGLCSEGVHNVLTVTGDPIPSHERNEVKSVYNFNSRMLASYISALGEGMLSTPFKIFGALNVNAHNFNIQLRLALEKEENGIVGFLTQPVLTKDALENLKLARKTLKGKLLCGIFPLVSYKNASYMSSEVSGIKIAPEIIELYKDKNREECEELAIKISCEIAKKAEAFVDGYYLITPFSRSELVIKIMNKIREQTKKGHYDSP